MENKNFTLKNKVIKTYRTKLAGQYERHGMERAPKECLAKTYLALDAAVKDAEATYVKDEAGNITNQEAVDNATQEFTALLMNKAEIPKRWSPQQCNEWSFMIIDW